MKTTIRMWNHQIFCPLALLLALFGFSFTVTHAQTDTVVLEGTVQDQSGAVIPGAAITVVDNATQQQRHSSTNQAGIFSEPGLPPGGYTIKVAKEGFHPVSVENVILHVADRGSYSIRLTVGNSEESVTVDGSGSSIDTTDAAVSTVVDRQFVQNLPLNGRSFQSLLSLTPGVNLNVSSANSSFSRGQFVVNGQSRRCHLLDGRWGQRVNGHLVLLRLQQQDYPATKLAQDWPSWNLPTLKWAREQGAVAGYADCGHGMVVDTIDLPNYEIPPMDGIGTQEAIVDVTHGVCDFLSGCDTHPAAELNAWYHLLNCGYRLVMVGETDYPCVTDERVGVGRSYVRLDHRPIDNAGYEAWIQGLKKGRLYCGDGRSHFLDFKVHGCKSGDDDVVLREAGSVKVEALVGARLDPERDEEMEAYLASPVLEISPTWHLEHARIGKTRNVPVELIVNGVGTDRIEILADGAPTPVSFKTGLARSSWVALRILPSSHTYPVFVALAGKPIRASKRSAQWCRACVDKLWEVKFPFIGESERMAAIEAYEHVRKTYDTISGESENV